MPATKQEMAINNAVH